MARPVTITVFGDAQLDTAVKKVGSASLLLPRDSAGNLSYVEFDLRDNPKRYEYDSALGTEGDFTIEFYFRVNDFNGTDVQNELCSIGSTGAGVSSIWVSTSSFKVVMGGIFGTELQYDKPGGFSTDTWYHFMVSRNLETTRLFIDGVVVKTKTGHSTTLDFNDPSYLGEHTIGGIPDCYIDLFRISTEARETGTFTPPTTRYLDDDQTQVLLQLDGPDGSTDIEDFVPETLNASANLALTNGITTSARIRPTTNPDGVTWDEIVSWDEWYYQDNWNAALVYDIAIDATVTNALITKQAEAELSLSVSQEVSAANYQLAQAELNLATLTATAGRDLDIATAELNLSVDSEIEGRRFLGGSAELNLAVITVSDSRDLDIAGSELAINLNTEIRGGVERNASAEFSNTLGTEIQAGRILNGGFFTTNPETWDTVPNDQWDGFTDDQWGENYGLLPMQLSAEAGFLVRADAELNLATVTVFAGESVAPVTASAELSISIDEEIIGGVRSPASAELPMSIGIEADVLNVLGSGSNLTISMDSEQTARRFVGGSTEIQTAIDLVAEAEDFDNAASLLLADINIEAKAGLILETAQAELLLANIQVALGRRFVGGDVQLGLDLATNIRPTVIPAVDPFELPINLQSEIDANITASGSANLNLATVNLTDGKRLPGGEAELTIDLGVETDAVLNLVGSANLNLATITVTDGESRAPVRATATLNLATVTVFAGDLKLLDSDFVFRIYAETRLLTPKGETRTYRPYSETRVIEVDS